MAVGRQPTGDGAFESGSNRPGHRSDEACVRQADACSRSISPVTVWRICSWTPSRTTPTRRRATHCGPGCRCSPVSAIRSRGALPQACSTPSDCRNSSTIDLASYEALALELATNSKTLLSLKQQTRGQSPDAATLRHRPVHQEHRGAVSDDVAPAPGRTCAGPYFRRARGRSGLTSRRHPKNAALFEKNASA